MKKKENGKKVKKLSKKSDKLKKYSKFDDKLKFPYFEESNKLI